MALLAAAVACEPADLRTLIADSRDRLYSQQFSAALETIERAVDAVPCHDAHLAPELLASLYQSAGVIAHHAGEDDRAAAWLDDAVRIAPLVPYDRALGDEGAALYRAAQERIAASSTVTVEAGSGILLDGWPLDAGRSRSVAVGSHFTQILGEDGAVQTELLSLTGSQVTLGSAPAEPILPPAGAPSLPLVYGGMSLAAAGMGLTLGLGGWSWYRAGQYDPFPDYASVSASHRRRAILFSAAGAALVGGGTAMMVRGVSVQPADSGAVVAVHRSW